MSLWPSADCPKRASLNLWRYLLRICRLGNLDELKLERLTHNTNLEDVKQTTIQPSPAPTIRSVNGNSDSRECPRALYTWDSVEIYRIRRATLEDAAFNTRAGFAMDVTASFRCAPFVEPLRCISRGMTESQKHSTQKSGNHLKPCTRWNTRNNIGNYNLATPNKTEYVYDEWQSFFFKWICTSQIRKILLINIM